MKKSMLVKYLIPIILIIFLSGCSMKDVKLFFDNAEYILFEDETGQADIVEEELHNTDSVGAETIEESTELEEYAFTLPYEFSFTLWDIDIFSKNMDEWIAYFNENGESIGENEWRLRYTNIRKTDYYVYSVYLRTITMKEEKLLAKIQFDENNDIFMITICGNPEKSSMNIAGLQVGDNAKDYMNQIKDGLWDACFKRTLLESHDYQVVRSQKKVASGLYDVQSDTKESDLLWFYIQDKETVRYTIQNDIVREIFVYHER